MGTALSAQDAFDNGVRHQAAGDLTQAEASFRHTLAQWPDCAPAWVNLGLVREKRGDLNEAATCHRQAATLDPTLYEAPLNLGVVLTHLGQFDDAESAYQRAIALNPQAPAAWSNLGGLLVSMRRDADAEACCQHALALDPGHDKARFNLAYLLLRQGHLTEGWLCLEAREGPALLQSKLPFARWAGDALAGRDLLLVNDAAHGDLIQMARYGRWLKARGAGGVTLYAQPALKKLLARETGFDKVLGFDEPLPQTGFDLWSPVMSLPHLCGTQLDNLPAELPYLRPDSARLAHWHRQIHSLAPADELKVGLAWRGNPLHESDSNRSLHDLALLAPLGLRTGARFINLQHGASFDELQTLSRSLNLLTLPEPLGDFDETSAIVANLDLVISVDTSAVHLAGAIGTPTWVLLHEHKTDWRWLNDRADSPWYPGVMRLFRQPRQGDWASVITEVASALQDWSRPV